MPVTLHDRVAIGDIGGEGLFDQGVAAVGLGVPGGDIGFGDPVEVVHLTIPSVGVSMPQISPDEGMKPITFHVMTGRFAIAAPAQHP
ncbi:hypothetical protein D3C73_1590110 [compost metagenome]